MDMVSMFFNVISQVLMFSLIPFIWWLVTARRKENFFLVDRAEGCQGQLAGCGRVYFVFLRALCCFAGVVDSSSAAGECYGAEFLCRNGMERFSFCFSFRDDSDRAFGGDFVPGIYWEKADC